MLVADGGREIMSSDIVFRFGELTRRKDGRKRSYC